MKNYSPSREKRTVARYTSSMSAESVMSAAGLPQDPAGMKILDIGAGWSDAVAWLCEMGAHAFALDPLYRPGVDSDEFYRRSEELREERLIERYGLQLGRAYSNSLKDSNRAAREITIRDRKEHPARYVPGYAGALPFRDGCFDLVFSINCITHGLDEDYGVFMRAVAEALRVLKPQGRLHLYPVLWSSYSVINRKHEELINRFAGDLITTPGAVNPKLILQKP